MVAHEPHEIDDDSHFIWSCKEEPHASRRKAILAAHPEIKSLMSYDPNTKYLAMFMVVVQTVAAVWVSDKPIWVTLLVAYALGAMISQALLLCMHECSHYLLFKSRMVNKLFGIGINSVMLLPASVKFGQYHKEHHKYQGHDAIDVDIPSELEAKIFQGTFGKLIWVMLQGFFYAFRPVLQRPKPFSFLEALNMATCFGYGYLMYTVAGPWALFYLAMSDVFGMGLHPVAGHFIAEHYVFVDDVETYSYLGPLRWAIFNVGFHTAHHDFPNIPGSRLAQVRAMAPEFYDNLPVHTSYTKVIYDFITNPEMSLYKRVKRSKEKIAAAAAMHED